MSSYDVMGTPQHSTLIASRARIHRLIALLALLLLPMGKSEAANEHALCREAFLQIVSPDVLTMDQCKAVGRQTMEAWKFDVNQMHWANSTDMETPLTLRLLSVDRMKVEHAGVLGYAKGRDLFVVSTSVLDDPFANGTLAHGLAHIQAKRALGRLSEKHLVPRYFIEGHGNILGRAYRDHLRITNHDYDARKARQIMKLSADEARTILTDDAYGTTDKKEEDKMESMGIFFVEYMRVRHHRAGIPDVVPRMARVFELVGGGKPYESAFREQFGASVDGIVSEISAFMRRTTSDPAERLKGTRYEEFR